MEISFVKPGVFDGVTNSVANFFTAYGPPYNDEYGGDIFEICKKPQISWHKVHSMLNGGCNPNMQDKEYLGTTPLIYASKLWNIEVSKILRKAGADINGQNELSQTPLICACISKPLDEESTERRNSMLVWLIKEGAYVDACDKAGMRAFDYALTINSMDAARILVSRNASVFRTRELTWLPIRSTKKLAKTDEMRSLMNDKLAIEIESYELKMEIRKREIEEKARKERGVAKVKKRAARDFSKAFEKRFQTKLKIAVDISSRGKATEEHHRMMEEAAKLENLRKRGDWLKTGPCSYSWSPVVNRPHELHVLRECDDTMRKLIKDSPFSNSLGVFRAMTNSTEEVHDTLPSYLAKFGAVDISMNGNSQDQAVTEDEMATTTTMDGTQQQVDEMKIDENELPSIGLEDWTENEEVADETSLFRFHRINRAIRDQSEAPDSKRTGVIRVGYDDYACRGDMRLAEVSHFLFDKDACAVIGDIPIDYTSRLV